MSAPRPKKRTHKYDLRPKKLTPRPTPRPEKPLPLNKPKYNIQNKIDGVFDDKCIEYKIESNEPLLIKEYLENTRSYFCDMIDNSRTSNK